MNEIFISIYEFFHGIQADPLWEDVYIASGWSLTFVTIIILIFYYHILNRFFIRWHFLRHWFLFMLINGIVNTLISYFISISILEPIEFATEFLTFAIINLFLSAVFYALFSLLLCLGSPKAKYTPYKFYHKNKLKGS